MDRNVKQLEYVSPEIKYKNGPMDTFVHVDFIHRWFGVIDTKKMVKYGAHANVVFGADKRQYTFREGWLIGFRRIPESEVRAERIRQLLGNIDVSVDVHQRSGSWAVVSLQGGKTDYIKFVDLDQRSIREIAFFLRQFDRNHVKIDANPFDRQMLNEEIYRI